MKNFVPYFISEKYSLGEYSGSFTGCSMFLDLSGFTSVTDKLMREDKEGIEVMGNFLSQIFESIVASIHGRGGFVSSFEGDALIAIFPGEESFAGALSCSDEINGFFSNKSVFKTKYGNFFVSIKTGISYGDIEYFITGNEKRMVYTFSGDAIKKSIKCQKNCDLTETVIDAVLNIKSFGFAKTRSLSPGLFVLEKILFSNSPQTPVPLRTKESDHVFTHPNLVNYELLGEFRRVSPVFISIGEMPFESRKRVIESIIERSIEFGGYLNKVTYNDKGLTSLVIFGAPVSFDNNLERACDFSLRIKQAHGDLVKIGLSHGIVYSGFVGGSARCEYTVLGNVVNLASRLMTRALPGEILASKDLLNAIEPFFEIGDFSTERLKGFEKEKTIFKIFSRKTGISKTDSDFIGREFEINFLLEKFNIILSGSFPGLIYVYGEAGIGKSKLLREFQQRLKRSARTFVFTQDPILKKSMDPIRTGLKIFFNILDESDSSQRVYQFENKFEELVSTGMFSGKDLTASSSNESPRLKIVLGYFLGFYSDHPYFSGIEKNKIPDLIDLCLRDFFRAFSLFTPTVMVFEDFSDYDEDTLNFMKTFLINIQLYPLMIVLTSRINDDESKSRIKTDSEIQSDEILLSEIPPEQTTELINNLLEGECDNSVHSFIFRRTKGNPFFVEQYCLFLSENGYIMKSGGIFRLERGTDEIPLKINDVIISRIDRLTDEIKSTVKISSVLGMEFEIGILKELINLFTMNTGSDNPENIDGQIKKTSESKVWSRLSDLVYIFSHTLLRDSIYQMQLKENLRTLHKLSGDVISKAKSGNPSYFPEIAHHYEMAELPELAIEYYKKSAEDSLEKYYLDKAWEYLKRALRMSIKLFGGMHPVTADVLKTVSIHLFEKGRYRAAISAIKRSLEIREKFHTSDLETKINHFLNIGINYRYLGEYDKALEAYESCLALQPEGSEPPEEILTNIAVIYKEKNEYQKSLDYSEKALKKQVEAYGEFDARVADTYNNFGVVFTDLNRLEEALSYHKKSIEIMEKAGKYNSPKTAYFLSNLSVCAYYMTDLEKSLEFAGKALDIIKEIYGEKHPDVAFLYCNIGAIYNDVPDHGKAIEFFQKSLEIYQDTIGLDNVFVLNIYNNLGYSYVEKGDFENALKYTEDALSGRLKHFGPFHVETSTSFNQLGTIKTELWRFKDAMDHYGKSLRGFNAVFGVANKYSIIVLTNMSKTLIKAGDLQKSLSILIRAESLNKNLVPHDDQSTARIEEYLGNFFFASGDHQKSRKRYEKARDIYFSSKRYSKLKQIEKKLSLINGQAAEPEKDL